MQDQLSAIGLNVSRETSDRLSRYVGLVEKWTPRINLVSRASVPHILDRHILDSAQIFTMAPPAVRHWADLGSGGGFPGLVVAILCAELSPDTQVTLVESDVRKAVFLQTVIRDLQLSATVRTERIEALAPMSADVLSARALAPLPQLLDFCLRHLEPDGTGIFPKGAQAEQEVADARKTHRFHLDRRPSMTDPSASVLLVKGVTRV